MKYLFNVLFLSLLLVSCDKTECLESNCTEGVPLSYIPVCGCNDITYPNWQTAECHGIKRYKKGECCANIPELGNSSCIDSTLIVSGGACITVYEPVCGCNGVTYSNSCVATTRGGVSSYVDGECCD